MNNRKCYLKQLNGGYKTYHMSSCEKINKLKDKIGLDNKCSGKDVKIIHKSIILNDQDNIIFGDTMIYMIKKSSEEIKESIKGYRNIKIHHITYSLLEEYKNDTEVLVQKIVSMDERNYKLITKYSKRKMEPLDMIKKIIKKNYSQVVNFIRNEHSNIRLITKDDWKDLKIIIEDIKVDPIVAISVYHGCNKNMEIVSDVLFCNN